MNYKLCYTLRKEHEKDGKCPLFLLIKIGDKRSYVSTGFKIATDSWNPELQEVNITRGNKKDAESINRVLESTIYKVRGIVADLMDAGRTITPDLIAAKLKGKEEQQFTINNAFEKYMEVMNTKERSKATAKKFQYLKGHVQKFTKTEDIHLSKIDYAWISDFFSYMRSSGMANNTAVKYLASLKSAILEAKKRQWIKINPFEGFKTELHEIDQVFLTQEELNRLEKAEMTSDTLERVRDFFVFQCYTGLSYAEISNLTMKQIVPDMHGNNWIITHRQKSTAAKKYRQEVPLTEKAEAILNKYKGQGKEDRIFPISSNQKVNDNLKLIAGLANIDKKISSHAARRTAGTIWINAGVPTAYIIKWLGHATFKMLHKYATISKESMAQEMKRFEGKIQEQQQNLLKAV